jgi:tetratricopeptide (TPR) repeat protein
VLGKRGSWFARIAVLIGMVGLLGFSVSPMVSAVLEARQANPQTPANTQPTQQSAREELQAQAKGYELVLQREPDNQAALLGLLQVRMQLEDIKGTLEPLEKLAQINPKEARYQVLLAQTKQYLGDREGAAQTFRSILNAQPGNIAALQGLVALLIDEKRPEAAIGLLESTLKAAPQANQIEKNSVDVIAVRLLMGQVYAQQKRYEEAITVYDNLSKENDKDFRPVLAKAIVFQEQGKKDEARSYLERSLSLAPAQYKDPIQMRIDEIDSPESAAPAAPQSESKPDAAEPSATETVPEPPAATETAPEGEGTADPN